MHVINKKYLLSLFLVISFLPILSGCNLPASFNSLTGNSESPDTTSQRAAINFKVTIEQALPVGDSLYLSILDEVTGLAFNVHKYVMSAEDPLNYKVTLPFTLGEVIKYRYSREGSGAVNEHLFNGLPVRYRLYHVEGPGNIEDVISQWTDTKFVGPNGQITGVVTNASTGTPIPNIMISGGGEQVLSRADGSFLMEGIPQGVQNLVFYALDGSYQIYQQGAVVRGNSTTPVSVKLSPAQLVTAIFTITIPSNTPPGAPIRFAGSLYQLGNTFADLSGGVSGLASRMPVMGKLPDGRYMLTLNLPAGTYLEYKYTLGDGLWSSEVTSNGAIQLHRMIIPGSGFEVEDTVEAWNSGGTNPIEFEAQVPADTPKSETVSIQFNPGFGWLEPLPMWSGTNTQGETVWKFDLTGPFNNLTSLKYRYCRQNQCGIADDSATTGLNPNGRMLDPSKAPRVVQDNITSWAWLGDPNASADVPDTSVSARGAEFIAGISLLPTYQPSLGPLFPQTIATVQSLNANWLIFSPTWTFTNSTPPILEPQPSQDMLYPDVIDLASSAEQSGLSIGIYPTPRFPSSVDSWWQDAPRDYTWWVAFFERYSSFVLNYARIASQTKATVLLLGGDWLSPALPGGTLIDSSPSNVPQDAETRWRQLIQLVRERFSGRIAWVLSYPKGVINQPPFLDAVDQIYILWSVQLASQPGASREDMKTQADYVLNQDLQSFQQQWGKPVIIGISYPSVTGSSMGCIALQGGGCLDYDLLNPPNPDIPALEVNLQEQEDAYNAILSAINDNSWIAGYVSMGYYPPAVLQDKSLSIHGKPASGVFWYWSGKYLGR